MPLVFPLPKCGAPSRGCNAALLAAITVMPGVVFTGSNDGADGMVYINSGYGALGGRPGNVLLAFGIE